jgi:4-phospho-D-threonate 3-dehydrogenase / 4-phospho-D-erythronate 3-dehydrogenase
LLEKACKVDSDRVLRTIQLGDSAMRLMPRHPPRIGVCGLNPHAGERVLFGRRDMDPIAPAVEQAHALDIECSGPLLPDTIFVRGLRGEFDLIGALYHDHLHISMKVIDFEGTVNASLGIPILRTSVDQGTAFDIQGKSRDTEYRGGAAACRWDCGRPSSAEQFYGHR